MLIQLDWLKQYVDFDLSAEEIGSRLSMIGLEMERVKWVELSNGSKTEVMELNVTPNRGYCLSHIGVAREVAALLNATTNLPTISDLKYKEIPVCDRIKVVNEVPDLCPRYALIVIENVTPGISPRWLQDRLNALGLRSINNIVDITNFVLMEYGQPLHSFDHNRLSENTIIIRRAGKHEMFKSLMGDQLKLDTGDLVIADADKPVALAGVMGGANSEVTRETRSVALESAFFDPVSIRRTSRKYAMSTDSSYRFERCVDIDSVIIAQNRAAQLIQKLAGGNVCDDRIDIYPKPPNKQTILLRIARVKRVLGMEFTSKRLGGLLERLELEVREQKLGEEFLVTVPHSRPTLTREIDLIEEIARLNGFENILAGNPVVTVKPLNPKKGQTAIRKSKETLSHLGYSEVVSYSFIQETLASKFKSVFGSGKALPIILNNPISEDMKAMRTSLLPGLLKTLTQNLKKGQRPVKIFEMGSTFFKEPGVKESYEKTSFAGLVHGGYENNLWKQQGEEYDFYDLKGILETVMAQFKLTLGYEKSNKPFLSSDESMDCLINGTYIGLLGKIKSKELELCDAGAKIYVFEIDFDSLVKHLPDKVRFVPIPRFPESYRDISILVDKTVASKTISDLIKKAGNPIIGSVELYDYFEGKKLPKGKKSLTFALVFQATEKTLSDEEVNPVFDRIVAMLYEKQGAILRES